MNNGITCLGIQFLNTESGIKILILKILLGKRHEIKIPAISGGNQRLHISCVRVNSVHRRGKHGPRNQHRGKFAVNSGLHPFHRCHLVPDLPLSVLCFVAVVDYPVHYSGILALGGISGIISLYSIISAIHVLFFIGSLGRQAAARPHILVQTIFIYLKFPILSIGLYDVGLLIKPYLIFTNQVIRCVCAVIPEIRTACLIVDICFPCAFILADIRHIGKGYFPGIVPGKMPVSQLPVHIRRNLFHNNVCAVGKHDGMIEIIILPIPGIALQRGHITIRPSAYIAVPGNSQPVIQSGKNRQIAPGLIRSPKKGLFVGRIAVKPRFRRKNFRFISIYIIVVHSKLLYCLLGLFPFFHLHCRVHGIKEFRVVIASVLFCFQQPLPASIPGRKKNFLDISFEIRCPYIF